MEKRNLWILLGKKLSGEITADERVTLERMIKESGQDISYLIEFLEEEWKKKVVQKDPDDSRREESWRKLNAGVAETGTPVRKFRRSLLSGARHSWYKIAACLLTLLLGLYFLNGKFSSSHMGGDEITVANGTKKHVKLPDGTEVWLNAGSRLWYKGSFLRSDREVRLEGEGFFKVVHDASVPFTVRTSGVTIKVLGTNFNIKAYKDDPDVQTTLISGKIQVELNDDPDKKIILSPHEKLTVISGRHFPVKTPVIKSENAAKGLPSQPGVNALKYQVQALPLNPRDTTYFTETAWVRNQLAFSYQPFSEVAREMDRRYNVHICFRDPALKQVLMSGVFDKETVVEALNVLQMITRFHYQVTSDSIFLDK